MILMVSFLREFNAPEFNLLLKLSKQNKMKPNSWFCWKWRYIINSNFKESIVETFSNLTKLLPKWAHQLSAMPIKWLVRYKCTVWYKIFVIKYEICVFWLLEKHLSFSQCFLLFTERLLNWFNIHDVTTAPHLFSSIF